MMKGGGQINVATSSNQYQQFGSDRTVLYVNYPPTTTGSYSDPSSKFGITADQIRNLKAGDVIRYNIGGNDRDDYLVSHVDLEMADNDCNIYITSYYWTNYYCWNLHDDILTISKQTVSISESNLNSDLKTKLRDTIYLNKPLPTTSTTYTYTSFSTQFGVNAQTLYSFVPGTIIRATQYTYSVLGKTSNIVNDHIGIRLSGLKEGDLNTISEFIIDFNWDDEKITIIPYTWKLDAFPEEYSLNSQYWPESETTFQYPSSPQLEQIYAYAKVGDYIKVNEDKYIISAVEDGELTTGSIGHKIITTQNKKIDITAYSMSGGPANRVLEIMMIVKVKPLGLYWEEHE